MLSPRAVAGLGLRYAPALTARLGLWPVSSPPPAQTVAPDFGVVFAAPSRAARRSDDDEVLMLLLMGR